MEDSYKVHLILLSFSSLSSNKLYYYNVHVHKQTMRKCKYIRISGNLPLFFFFVFSYSDERKLLSRQVEEHVGNFFTKEKARDGIFESVTNMYAGILRPTLLILLLLQKVLKKKAKRDFEYAEVAAAIGQKGTMTP